MSHPPCPTCPPFSFHRRSSVQERYDSLTNSVKESSIVEPTVPIPATGKKVSIPDAFNSPSASPTTSPVHAVKPINGVVGVAKEGPVPSPKTRRKAEGSLIPVPSPKTARRTRLRSGDVTSDPHPAVGNGQGHPEALQNGPQSLENGEQQQNGQQQQQNGQEPQTVGNGTAN